MKGFHKMEVTVSNVDIDAVGEAVLEDGTLLKIAGAAPGDRVLLRPSHKSPHRKVVWCDIIEILSRGPHFISPVCPHAEAAGGLCGGCPAMHLDKETYRAMKIRRVRQALESSGLMPLDISFEEADQCLEYRNRGHFAAARNPKGRPYLGVFAPRNRRIIEIEQCKVIRPAVCDAAHKIEELLDSLSVPIYPEPFGLRYVTLRASKQGEVLVDLVVADGAAPWIEPFADRLISCPPIVGVSFCENAAHGNALRAAPSIHLAGLKTVVERVGKIDLHLTAAGFSQLHSGTAAAMYRRAADMTKDALVLWDLYCGVGGLGLTVLSSQSPNARLFGAEFVKEAVELATMNATNTGGHAVFETRDLSTGAPPSWPAPDVILLNPPRRGLDVAVLESLKTTAAQTVIYMSCDPSSFARDAASLVQFGFQPGEVFAHDMLPQTAHVELIVSFHRSSAVKVLAHDARN
jgi:23S rRNA (uracil-5-)-methyltransferase RumA